MANAEMLIIKRGFDFSKWLLRHTGKFPKSYRFSVAAKLENGILDFIEAATVANMRKNKLPLTLGSLRTFGSTKTLTGLKGYFRMYYFWY